MYELNFRDFPGSPVVRTWRFHCRRVGFDQGTKIPKAVTKKKKKSQKITKQRKTTKKSVKKTNKWGREMGS